MPAHKLDFDVDTIQRMAQFGMTQKEMAYLFGVGHATVERRLQEPEYRDAYEYGMSTLKMNLRREQVCLALGLNRDTMKQTQPGDRTMLIWLGKQLLGQKDRLEATGANDQALFDSQTKRIADGFRAAFDAMPETDRPEAAKLLFDLARGKNEPVQ